MTVIYTDLFLYQLSQPTIQHGIMGCSRSGRGGGGGKCDTYSLKVKFKKNYFDTNIYTCSMWATKKINAIHDDLTEVVKNRN